MEKVINILTVEGEEASRTVRLEDGKISIIDRIIVSGDEFDATEMLDNGSFDYIDKNDFEEVFDAVKKFSERHRP